MLEPKLMNWFRFDTRLNNLLSKKTPTKNTSYGRSINCVNLTFVCIWVSTHFNNHGIHLAYLMSTYKTTVEYHILYCRLGKVKDHHYTLNKQSQDMISSGSSLSPYLTPSNSCSLFNFEYSIIYFLQYTMNKKV